MFAFLESGSAVIFPFIFFFFFKTPQFEGKYFTVHKPAFTSVRIPVECSVSDILACYTSNCFRKKWMLNYALKYILSSTGGAVGGFCINWFLKIKLQVFKCPLSLS